MYRALGTFKQITELVDVRQSGASATAVSITSTPPTVGSPRAAARTTWNITGGNSMASAIASNPSAPVTPACSPSAMPGRVTVRRQARTKRNLSAGSVLQLSATHRLSPRQRVLFVEDNERVVYSVSRMLALEQFEVQPALDGKTALELVHQHNFDVILLDLVLPDQTGIDVLRRLRFEGNWTPAVILTGRGDFGSALEAGKLGVTEYLTKPPKLPELVRALRLADGGKRSETPTLFAPATGHPSEGIPELLAGISEESGFEHGHAVRLLAGAACLPSLSFLEFVAVSKGLRSLSLDLSQTITVGLIRMHHSITQASRRTSTSAMDRVTHVVRRIENAGKAWSRLSDASVAAELAMPPAALGQLLSDECSLTFSRARRAVLMRKAALELAAGSDHVRQIAYRLGYSDAANLDHDFRDFFGVTPTAFRRLQQQVR